MRHASLSIYDPNSGGFPPPETDVPDQSLTLRSISNLLLAVIPALAGCQTQVPEPSSELELETPQTWTATETSNKVPLLATDWIESFDDPTLTKIVAEAIEANYDLAATAARLNAARASAIVSGADRYPQLSAGADGSQRELRSDEDRLRTESYSLSLDLSWEIDIWGRLNDRARAGQADYEAAQADYEAARLSLAAITARSWFNAVEAELQVQLAENIYRSFQSNLETIENRFRTGLSRALDLRLTRANVAAAASNLEFRLRRRDEAIRSLETILGRYPNASQVASSHLPRPPAAVPAGLPADLISRRPDLIASERRLAAADARYRESKKAMLPSIRLTGSAGTTSAELGDLLDGDFGFWNLAGGITQPLFQGRRLKAGSERSKANREAVLAEYASSALQAFREVETTLAAENTLLREEAALKMAEEESIAAEDLAWEEYEAGLSDIITVLESQRRAFSAQRDLLSTRNSRLQNRINLHLALGGSFSATTQN
jgi:NodT family efflux transporter outer membrane factor (OMF) lipoprotein